MASPVPLTASMPASSGLAPPGASWSGPLHSDNEEVPVNCPVYAGSAADRLSDWCAQDVLEQEASVLAALAHIRERLHALPATTRPEQAVAFEAGAVATLVCAVQSQVNQSSSCAR